MREDLRIIKKKRLDLLLRSKSWCKEEKLSDRARGYRQLQLFEFPEFGSEPVTGDGMTQGADRAGWKVEWT